MSSLCHSAFNASWLRDEVGEIQKRLQTFAAGNHGLIEKKDMVALLRKHMGPIPDPAAPAAAKDAGKRASAVAPPPAKTADTARLHAALEKVPAQQRPRHRATHMLGAALHKWPSKCSTYSLSRALTSHRIGRLLIGHLIVSVSLNQTQFN